MRKPTRQGQKESTTDRVAGATTLTGAKPSQLVKRDTKRKSSIKKGWVAVKSHVNDG